MVELMIPIFAVSTVVFNELMNNEVDSTKSSAFAATIIALIYPFLPLEYINKIFLGQSKSSCEEISYDYAQIYWRDDEDYENHLRVCKHKKFEYERKKLSHFSQYKQVNEIFKSLKIK